MLSLPEVDLFCQQLGRGRDVVLIHGLAANHAAWPLQILLGLSRSYRVTTYDLRGHGRSSMPTTGYTSLCMAQDLEGLLNALNIHDAVLIGHSYGGLIALQYVLNDSARVNTVIIVDVRHRSLQPHIPLDRWPGAAGVLEQMEVSEGKCSRESSESGLWLLEQLALQEGTCGPVEKGPGRREYVPFGGWNGSRRSARKWIQLLEETSFREDLISDPAFDPADLNEVPCSIHALYGEKSPLVETLEGLKALLPRLDWKIIPGAGHFIPWTHPDVFLEAVLHVLEG